MTKGDLKLTRRKALAGAGAIGFATLGMGRGRPTASWNEYVNYTRAETNGRRLLVGWQSTYDGSGTEAVVVDGPTDEADSADGVTDVPLIDLDDVLPGDEGAASVGLRVEDDLGEGLRAWMQIIPTVGSDRPSTELADRIQIDIRYDTGLLGVGGCEGADGPFADFGTEIFSGSFADLAGGSTPLSEGILLDPRLFGDGCLTPGDQRCLLFHWRFPVGRGNAGKGGSVDFDVTFGVDPCGADTTNPFQGGGADDDHDAEAST